MYSTLPISLLSFLWGRNEGGEAKEQGKTLRSNLVFCNTACVCEGVCAGGGEGDTTLIKS